MPKTIQYQGMLLQNGEYVTATAVPMRFALYGEVSGGNELWGENHAVDVNSGRFEAVLGDVNNDGTALDSVDFKHPLYLQITVDGDVLSRLPFHAVPYAMTAAGVQDGAVDSNAVANGAISNIHVAANAAIDPGKIAGIAAVLTGDNVITDENGIPLTLRVMDGDRSWTAFRVQAVTEGAETVFSVDGGGNVMGALFMGDGSGLTDLAADQVTTGVLPLDVLPSEVSLDTEEKEISLVGSGGVVLTDVGPGGNSGAALIGVHAATLANASSADLQQVLKEFDTAITDAGSQNLFATVQAQDRDGAATGDLVVDNDQDTLILKEAGPLKLTPDTASDSIEFDLRVGPGLLVNPVGGVLETSVDNATIVIDGETGRLMVGAITTADITDFSTAVQTIVDGHATLTDNPHNVTKAQLGLDRVANVLDNLAGTAQPGATDDAQAGYSIGSHWIDTASGLVYICLDASAGDAWWSVVNPADADLDLSTHMVTEMKDVTDSGSGAIITVLERASIGAFTDGVDEAELNADAVTSVTIKDGEVGTGDIAAGAVTMAKLASDIDASGKNFTATDATTVSGHSVDDAQSDTTVLWTAARILEENDRLEWRRPVDSVRDFEPNRAGVPGTDGERHIAAADYDTFVKDRIYEFGQGAWHETTPRPGFACYVADVGSFVVYKGPTNGWQPFAGQDLAPNDAPVFRSLTLGPEGLTIGGVNTTNVILINAQIDGADATDLVGAGVLKTLGIGDLVDVVPGEQVTGALLQFDGSNWISSSTAPAADDFLQFNGDAWEAVTKIPAASLELLPGGGLQDAGGLGLDLSGDGTLMLDPADQFRLKVGTLAAQNLQTGSVGTDQILNASIINADIDPAAAIDYDKLNVPDEAIDDNKLSQIVTADKVRGSAVELGTDGSLTDDLGLKVLVDGTSITRDGEANLQVGTIDTSRISDITAVGSGAIITLAERDKLAAIEPNAEVNVQADWQQTDAGADSFIQNKPTLPVGDGKTIEIVTDEIRLKSVESVPVAVPNAAPTTPVHGQMYFDGQLKVFDDPDGVGGDPGVWVTIGAYQ